MAEDRAVDDDRMRDLRGDVPPRAAQLAGPCFAVGCVAVAAAQTLAADPRTWSMIAVTLAAGALTLALMAALREWRPTALWLSTPVWPERDLKAALDRWEWENENG